MSIEGWKSFFDIGALALVFLTFTFGVGILITGNMINERQSAQLRKFDKDLTGAKTELTVEQGKTATAQADLTKLKTALVDAQKEADVARLALERQITSQQRRGAILMDPHNRATFGTPLKRFQGQKFDVIACGVKESEIPYFSMAVWSTLEGAGWTVRKTENDSPSCQPGIMVLVHPNAPAATVDAAKELLKSFGRIKLTEGGQVGKTTPRPDNMKPGDWHLAPSSVDSIVVLIGTHP